MVMLKALERHNVLTEGAQITPDLRKENPNCTMLYSAYLDELEKYKRQVGVNDGDDGANQ